MDNTVKNIFNIADKEYRKEIRVVSDKPKVNILSNKTPDEMQRILTEKYRNAMGTSNKGKSSKEVKDSKGKAVGDFFITDDFGEKERLKKEAKKHKKDEANKEQMYKLLVRKEFILKKLASMSLTKKKHINDIADLNYKLEMIDWELKKIQEESGLDYKKIQHGSKIQHLMAYVSKKFKKFKKFLSKNWPSIQNTIIGIGSVLVPFIFWIFNGRKKSAIA